MDKIQKFRIIGEPMVGGMGKVLHLFHEYWKKDVAMKQPLEKYVASEEGRRRFYEECYRWMTLGVHPHIVQCYYVHDIKGTPSVLMEWMHQGSLAERIRSGELYQGTESQILEKILDAALQMAEGLAYAHEKGILHLDVKPDNVLIDFAGFHKISDFGLASLASQKDNQIAYTPRYCAPEQQTGIGIGKGTDIYCWGVSVLHLLLGDILWMDGVAAGAGLDILLEHSRVPVPEELRRLLETCLSYRIQDRPEDFREVIRALVPLYERVSGTIYHGCDSAYDGTSLDAFNNMAISYIYLGDKERAGKQWLWNVRHNPEHQGSFYNYYLYQYRYKGGARIGFLDSGETGAVFHNPWHLSYEESMLRSEWLYSVGAYAGALHEAEKAAKAAEMLYGPIGHIYHENYLFMKAEYEKKGPALLTKLDLKQIWKIEEEIGKDCVLLAYAYDDRLVYVSRDGVFYLIDEKKPAMVRYKTAFAKISCAAVSRDGHYLALAEQSLSLTHKIHVLDLTAKKLIDRIEVDFAPEYLTFTEQGETCFRVVAGNRNKVFSRKLGTREEQEEKYREVYGNSILVKGFTETGIGCLLVRDGDFIKVYDSLTMMKWSEKLQPEFAYLQPHKITEIPGTNLVLFLDKKGGYLVYNYAAQCVVAEEHFYGEDKPLRQLAVNRKGDQMAFIQGDCLEVRRLSDYGNLPEPIWKESPFRTTTELLEKSEKILAMQKVCEDIFDRIFRGERLPDETLCKAVAVKMNNIRTYYYGSHSTVDEYLRLEEKMRKAFGK